jgi:hypothetical protein
LFLLNIDREPGSKSGTRIQIWIPVRNRMQTEIGIKRTVINTIPIHNIAETEFTKKENPYASYIVQVQPSGYSMDFLTRNPRFLFPFQKCWTKGFGLIYVSNNKTSEIIGLVWWKLLEILNILWGL